MVRSGILLVVVTMVAAASTIVVSAAGADWQTNYDKALATAKAQHKRVLLDFTGSDWCGPCIQLRKQVFSRPEFRKYAEKNLILVEIDFPQRKEQSAAQKNQNEKLAKQYGIEEKGFPTLVLLDPAGKTLREFVGYAGENVAEMIGWIEGTRKN